MTWTLMQSISFSRDLNAINILALFIYTNLFYLPTFITGKGKNNDYIVNENPFHSQNKY